MSTEISDPNELSLIPFGVRVVGCWNDSGTQYVSDTLAGHTVFTRRSRTTGTQVLWPHQVIESEIQVTVNPDDVTKALHILEALEASVASDAPDVLTNLIGRLEADSRREAPAA